MININTDLSLSKLSLRGETGRTFILCVKIKISFRELAALTSSSFNRLCGVLLSPGSQEDEINAMSDGVHAI